MDILGITETKKKEKGMIQMNERHILLFSGVQNNENARAGVGSVISAEISKNTIKLEYCSERILLLSIQYNIKKNNYTDNIRT